ncbi:SPFH domain-containing protein [Streptomyces sp. NBC_01754]|uniref:SPFH domain-containing protein n=1 Tax=Streptomyces sp. NBC_01754 TaxID=2975930 RepID=UPI002DD82ECA|nr:SPFH domain-containing protein [Streptomyces sp. NBC_01754]WSC93851.1 SPFH domain-containing protein [Streptomyces sp. NBC_01754]
MKSERARTPVNSVLPPDEFSFPLEQVGDPSFKEFAPQPGLDRGPAHTPDPAPGPDPSETRDGPHGPDEPWTEEAADRPRGTPTVHGSLHDTLVGTVVDPEPELEQVAPAGPRRRVPRAGTLSEVREFRARPVLSGTLALLCAMLCGGALTAIATRPQAVGRWTDLPEPSPPLLAALTAAVLLAAGGLLRNQEGHAVVLTRWGRYRGTVRRSGLVWVNPFVRRHRVDIRLRHFQGGTLHAVDRVGHPVVVGVLIVWRVKDTARAVFTVDDHEEFLGEQAVASVTETVSMLPCDRFSTPGPTLRDGTWFGEEATRRLASETAPAGLEVYSVQQLSLGYDAEVSDAIHRLRNAELDAELRTTVIGDAVDIARAALDRIRADEGDGEDAPSGRDAEFLRLFVLSLLSPSTNLKEWGNQWPNHRSSSS